jgi:hypothetical protein
MPVFSGKLTGGSQSQLDFKSAAEHLAKQNVHFLNAGGRCRGDK